MTKAFLDKIFKERTVDTKQYRYVLKEFAGRAEIHRLPIDRLDTTDAISGWETVKVIK